MKAGNAPARVLIVDDEPVNIHVLAEALGDDYQLRFATSADRALELLAEFRPDLLLLDVVMPDRDGFEILRLLTEMPETRRIPVIFVTAMSEVGDEEKGFALGAVDYITKPISAPIVRARVRTHLELKRQRDLLERSALIDGLTNIANRRHFDQALSERWGAAQRRASALMLVLLDIDHFKQFNDRYGHSAGDECLRAVAGALNNAFSRGDDLVARYGGEEFALILAAEDGPDQCRHLLKVVSDLNIPHQDSSAAPFVTVSAGALELMPSIGIDAAECLNSADELLYLAKRGGRNRCAYRAAENPVQIIACA